MANKTISLIVATLFIGKAVLAQITMSLPLIFTKPWGTYKQNLNARKPGGFSLEFLSSVKPNSRLSLGTIGGVSMYGNRTYNTNIVTNSGDTVNAEIFEDDCYTQLGGQARYQLTSHKRFSTYALGSLVWQGFFSHAEPTDDEIDYTPQYIWQGHSAVLGTGIGVTIPIHINRKNNSGGMRKGVFFDINYRTQFGTPTTYRNFDKITTNRERIALNEGVFKSAISYGQWQAGLIWSL